MAKPFIAVIDSEIFNPGVAGEKMPLNRLGPGSRESYVNKRSLMIFFQNRLPAAFRSVSVLYSIPRIAIGTGNPSVITKRIRKSPEGGSTT